MKLGLAIAKRREQLGITQVDLAKKVGVSKASVCRWESGDISNMKRDKIQKLAEALKISPLDLLKDDTDGFEDSPFEAYLAYIRQLAGEKNAPDDEIRSEISDMVKNLSDHQAEQLRDFLKGMIGKE